MVSCWTVLDGDFLAEISASLFIFANPHVFIGSAVWLRVSTVIVAIVFTEDVRLRAFRLNIVST
jgi:hypothetical protein